jgi:hypothetical protein
VRNQAVIRAVQAAGPLPSFELSRTERLNSGHHHDAVTIVTVLARRADGSEVTVEENRIDPQRISRQRRLVMPAQGLKIELDDHIKAKSSFRFQIGDPRLPGAAFMKHDPSTNCSKWLDGRLNDTLALAGQETILGVPVVRFERSGPANKHTVWMAPSLGCVLVRTKAEWGQGGTPDASVAVAETDYVKIGSPDDGLFAVPTDYSEMKPSDRHQLHVTHMGLKISETQRASNEGYYQQADAVYAQTGR